jgi:soluble lytic murein transglycosylase
VLAAGTVVLATQQPSAQTPSVINLTATVHPAVPADLSSMWYVPAKSAALSPVMAEFVRGVKLLDENDNAAGALPLVSHGALADTPLADYARYYSGLALLKLERFDAAEAAFAALAARRIQGHLPEDAALGQAEAREGRGDFAGALAIYAALLEKKPSAPHVVWFRTASAADRAGQTGRAIEAYRRVYYDYPLSVEAEDADTALTRHDAWSEADRRAVREIGRADALFAARRWTPARRSYDRARPFTTGADRDHVTMRLAACDVGLGRHRPAREALEPYLEGPLAEEATFHYLTALRGSGQKAEYVRRAHEFAAEHVSSPWAQDTLNALASHFIIDDEDSQADEVFRTIAQRYPKGRFTERALWRAGWWAYRQGRFADASGFFDTGAATFPRSDYRPSWLYWSARAAEQAGDLELAASRYRLAATDYHNTYYGRIAMERLQSRQATTIAPSLVRAPVPVASADAFPTADQVTSLIAAGLNREALNELQYAQRTWGDSPRLTATMALVHNRLGNIRPGINAMKRAYPQFMAAGGESLPEDILRVIFPVEYWSLLQKYAALRGLDPYLVAALVAQESNFDPEVRSGANAIGLMQVLPSTGRTYARKLGIRPFSAARLTNPEINVRIGTMIFSEEVRKYGGVHFALAAYNAGGSRVVAWQRERPGLPQDEFIDDIPFPETQNYVKRILGTAEDYRRLYRSR